MRIDPRMRRTRQHLVEAIMDLAFGKARLVHHVERGWASATFAGGRHSLTLAFEGAEAVAAGEEFIAALPHHEFTIPRQLVAEATVVSVEHALLPEPTLSAAVEILLLEDP